MTSPWIIIISLLIIAGAGSGTLLIVRYRRDMHAAKVRLSRVTSQVVDTDHGPIEYATVGSGPPVLLLHGAGGGYVQGLLMAKSALSDRFQVVAPSRFGYLRTPRQADDSPAAQADAYARLLDVLDIDRVALVAFSGGGPSTLQFALRYPERTVALVLVAAVSLSPELVVNMPVALLKMVFGSDFLSWLMTSPGRNQYLSMLGVTREVRAILTPEEQERLDSLLQVMHPASLNLDGILVDMTLVQYLSTDLTLAGITAPTLVMHAIDDKVLPYAHAEYNAGHIPGAQLVTLHSGGHLGVGQQKRLRREIMAFLNDYIAPGAEVWTV